MGYGYVASKYLESEANRGSSWPATVKLNDPDSHLNVRLKASTDADIIGKLKHGQVVTEYLDRTISSKWSRIGY